MRSLIKSLALSVFGYQRARAIRERLFPRRRRFSEADLILRHFAATNSGVMMDVGAHFGESLVPYLDRKWTIYAFEPDPLNRAELERRIDVSRIDLSPLAISDKEDEGVPFFASEESSGISALSAFRDTHREVSRVTVTTLDTVCARKDIQRVDFLKIDTEGYDLFVLRGFPWDRMKPAAILCEFEDSKTRPLGYTHKDLGDLLVEKGYEVYQSEWFPIVQYGVKHRWRSWREYPSELTDSAGWGNYVAFRDGLSDAAREYLRPFTARQ